MSPSWRPTCLGTQVLLNAALKHPVERFIHVSTSEVYGTAVQVPMTEEHPLNPTTPYAGAKAGADRLVYAYHVTYGLPCVIVRPFNTYGPYQHLEKAIPRFITAALTDTALTIHGDGSTARDWGYVDDLCHGLERVMLAELPPCGARSSTLARVSTFPSSTWPRWWWIGSASRGRSSSTRRIGQGRCSATSPASSVLGSFSVGRPRCHSGRGSTGLFAGMPPIGAWWEKLVWMKSVTIIGPGGQKVTY